MSHMSPITLKMRISTPSRCIAEVKLVDAVPGVKLNGERCGGPFYNSLISVECDFKVVAE